MATPSSAPATLRPEIAGSLEEFDLDAEANGYVALQLLPVFETAKQSGSFGIIPIEEILRRRSTKRAPGSGYNRAETEFGTGSYATEEHGFEEPVDKREAEIYSDFLDAEMWAAKRARATILREQEERAVGLVLGSSNTMAAGAVWTGAGTPVDDVEAAVQTVYGRCGLWPNVLCMDRLTFRNLRNNAQIIERIKYAGIMDPSQRSITRAALEQLFDIRIVISGITQNTAAAGQAASLASLWDPTKVAVLRVATGGDIREACYGRTFHWGQDGSQIGGIVETYEETQTRSTIVRVRHETDEAELVPEAVEVITGVQA